MFRGCRAVVIGGAAHVVQGGPSCDRPFMLEEERSSFGESCEWVTQLISTYHPTAHPTPDIESFAKLLSAASVRIKGMEHWTSGL